MKFPPLFTTKLAELRDGAREHRWLTGERDLGKSKIAEIIDAERLAQEVCDSLPPSRIIAFDSGVADAFTELRKTQLIRAGVTVSLAKIESRVAGLNSKLSRALADAEQELKRLATAQDMVDLVTIPGIGTSTQIPALGPLTEYHGDFLGKLDVMLSLCVELGAKIPEAKS